MRRRMYLGATLAILLLAARAGGQASKASTEWKPGPALLKKLAAAASLERFTIQPPKNYSEMKPDSLPPGMTNVSWVAKPRDDGSRASLSANFVSVPPAEQAKIDKLTLEQLADKFLGGIKRARVGFQAEKPESGTINGLAFVRVRWEGVEAKTDRNMRGFLYVARDGQTIVQLASQDYTPEATESLPLAEAAIQTFKKKKP